MNIPLTIVLLLISIGLYANDGAYFASGNQLIPINETDITVQKEILKLKNIDNKYIQVDVYYEFFNPGNDKELLVGFEALAPEGDVDGAPKNGKHPYMHDFTVDVNDELLHYQVAYVEDSLYVQNNDIKRIDLSTFEGSTDGNYIDFFYVYHFNATFKKGKNIIKHSYKFDVSGSIDYNYYFEYVLTAANRWGNGQIDDFTLIVDMGDAEVFSIAKTFFDQASEWKLNGKGKYKDVEGVPDTSVEKDAVQFYMRKGTLLFQKKNFKPAGEIFLYSFNDYLTH